MTNISKTVVNKYWNNLIINPEIDGVYPMGGGGLIEIYYRTYFEKLNFLKIINGKQKPSLLEIGCGAGRWAISLNKYLKNYTGLDISKISIEKAIELCNEKHIINCSFECVNVTDFKSEQKFDIIYFGGVTQYMQDEEIKNAIVHLKKFLNHGGLLVDRSTLTLESEQQINNRDGYFAIYRNENELASLFVDNGFQIISSMDSYSFLRGSIVVNFINKHPRLISILKSTPAISYNLLLFLTKAANFIKPKVFSEEVTGKFTHRFITLKLK